MKSRSLTLDEKRTLRQLGRLMTKSPLCKHDRVLDKTMLIVDDVAFEECWINYGDRLIYHYGAWRVDLNWNRKLIRYDSVMQIDGELEQFTSDLIKLKLLLS